MAPAEADISVEVIYCPSPGDVDATALTLRTGATLSDAVRASGVLARHGLSELPSCGVWGAMRAPDTLLRDRDRVELYRALLIDPKEARRQRHRQGKPSKTA